MGKIVKNGVTYSGSSDNADNVKYNNNVSNLDATNVQEAITEVNGKLTTALPSESSIHSLDNKIRIEEYQGGLSILLSTDETKGWYAMLIFDQIGLSYVKNDSNGYVSKRIV